MPFWKAGKNDDQVLDELKETQKQNADEFVKKQEHADEAQKSSLIIDNNFTPVEYDPQYILQVNHLKKYFPIKGGMVSKTVGYVKAVDGVTFNLKRGTTMGLVGESGCGKTTTGRTILRLYDTKTAGQVLFNGQEVYDLSAKEMRALRTKMQIIFQDPFSSLSPRMPVGEIIGEAVRHFCDHIRICRRNDADIGPFCEADMRQRLDAFCKHVAYDWRMRDRFKGQRLHKICCMFRHDNAHLVAELATLIHQVDGFIRCDAPGYTHYDLHGASIVETIGDLAVADFAEGDGDGLVCWCVGVTFGTVDEFTCTLGCNDSQCVFVVGFFQ